MFDGIPLGSAGRVVTNRNGEVVFLAKDLGQLPDPHGRSGTVAAPTVGQNEQLFGSWVTVTSLSFPP